MIFTSPPCDRHRPALVDFVDHGERGPATPAALEHLGHCRRCEEELTELALTIVALRRTGEVLRATRVPAPAPERVAALAAVRRPDPWRWRLQLGSMLAGAALAAIVVAPQIGLAPQRVTEARPQAGPEPAAISLWRAAEQRLARSPDRPPIAASVDAKSNGGAVVGSLPPRYIDALIRPWKEVPSVDTSAREWAAAS